MRAELLGLLGLLGLAEAEERGLLAGTAFQTAERSLNPDCQFIVETGHNLCGRFASYWRDHGLEFGDDGVSYRESLALFGYPISEELVDPLTGLVIQYFERARFEFHPANPAPYDVLLGRLGASLLDRTTLAVDDRITYPHNSVMLIP